MCLDSGVRLTTETVLRSGKQIHEGGTRIKEEEKSSQGSGHIGVRFHGRSLVVGGFHRG